MKRLKGGVLGKMPMTPGESQISQSTSQCFALSRFSHASNRFMRTKSSDRFGKRITAGSTQ